MKLRASVIALACLLAACATSAPSTATRSRPTRGQTPAESEFPASRPSPAAEPPAPESRGRSSAEDELARTEAELTSLLQAEGRVDCERACTLSANVERLAERICTVVAQLPPAPEITLRCSDARRRADAARAQVGPSCPCSARGTPAPAIETPTRP